MIHGTTTAQRPALAEGPPSQWWRTLGSDAGARKLPKGLDAAWDAMLGFFVPLVPRRAAYLRRAQRVLAWESRLSDLADRRLKEQALELRERVRRGRYTSADVEQAFAVVREVARRQLNELAFPEQVAAALALQSGCATEVATGEGKTLLATMPATVAGWRGRGCHIITVNDYLARRDTQWMGGIYRFCGLSVAAIEDGMAPEQRREAYAADITYCTNKEVTADFLRDRLTMGRRCTLASAILRKRARTTAAGPERLVMRGLEQAIVDEADSVLIDEAVTPLIISGQAPNAEQTEAFQQASQLAGQLEAQRDYRVNQRYREVRLTSRGRARLSAVCESKVGIWSGARRREELVSQALTALSLYNRDTHYVVQDDKIVIVDEFTGRLMPDRTWRDGLHQAVEAKEALPVQPPKGTLARISFQQFFRRYHRLCGMTGTAWESRGEFWQIYRMPTVRIPTHRPCIRQEMPDRVFATADAKWHAIVDHIREIHDSGRPVLVGTRSVEASERLSSMLSAAALEHEVLNAVRHAEEAKIIAGAGQEGRITVATNMAGRGTDIKLEGGVARNGGLHVIATERHEARRVDRQLFGRTGRQGDPGSAVGMVSLEDELIRRYRSAATTRLTRRIASNKSKLSGPLARKVFDLAQAKSQRMALRQRKAVLKTDDWLDQFLGFAGLE